MHISGKVSAIIPVAIDWLEQSCQLQGLRRKKICREVGWCLWGSLVHQFVFKENGLNTYCLFNPSKLSSLPIIPHSVGPLLVAGDPTHLSIVLYTITLSNVVSSNPQNKLMYIYIISYKNNIQENNENYISLSLSPSFPMFPTIRLLWPRRRPTHCRSRRIAAMQPLKPRAKTSWDGHVVNHHGTSMEILVRFQGWFF